MKGSFRGLDLEDLNTTLLKYMRGDSTRVNNNYVRLPNCATHKIHEGQGTCPSVPLSILQIVLGVFTLEDYQSDKDTEILNKSKDVSIHFLKLAQPVY